MITGRDIESFKFYRSRDMREFLQENEFWPAVLQLSESLGLEKYSSLEFLNAIRKRCVFYLRGISRFESVSDLYESKLYDTIAEDDESEETRAKVAADEKILYVSDNLYAMGLILDDEKISSLDIHCSDDYWVYVFSLKALSCFGNATDFQQDAIFEILSCDFDDFYAQMHKYVSPQITKKIVSIEKDPAFEKIYTFDFVSLPEKPESIPYEILIFYYESIHNFEEEMKELICAYKNKWERELFYQMYSDNYRRLYGNEGPSEGMQTLLAELEQLSKSDKGLEEIVPLPPVQQEVAAQPAQPVEAAPQPAAPVDVSAYDTGAQKCLRLALGDFFQSDVYKGMKFGKTHWRAVYEAYTEYAEPTFKDFARMLSTLFADKEKEWKLPDENNLSKAPEKKQWGDSDKYSTVYKYVSAKMEEYYNMD